MSKPGENRKMCVYLDMKIIFLKESWFSPDIIDKDVSLRGVTPFRYDKGTQNRKLSDDIR